MTKLCNARVTSGLIHVSLVVKGPEFMNVHIALVGSAFSVLPPCFLMDGVEIPLDVSQQAGDAALDGHRCGGSAQRLVLVEHMRPSGAGEHPAPSARPS